MIDTKEIREWLKTIVCYGGKQTSTHGWVKVDSKYVIESLLDTIDGLREELKRYELKPIEKAPRDREILICYPSKGDDQMYWPELPPPPKEVKS